MRLTLSIGRRSSSRRRLREDRSLLNALLETVDVAIVACAADGRLTHANRRACELIGADCSLGTAPETWIRTLRPRTPSGIALPFEDLPPVRALQGEMLRGVDVLVSIRDRDVLLSATASPALDPTGRPGGALVLLEDVTEQRRSEAGRRQGGP
ncbi:MAG TPA: PAS domain-containing protein [Solirubrobacteraceae bacterium]|nr:PAS domain-containing protein [Solirubrobacteraceae bacterium]